MAKTTKSVSISLDDPTLKKGKRQAKKRGFRRSFSAYVDYLIAQDAHEIEAMSNGAGTNGRSMEDAAHA